MPKDYYEVLGVSRDASFDDIKQAYRHRSKEWHPDKHKGEKDAEKRFKEINEAYEVLGNPEKRKMYDQFGATGQGGGFQGFRGSGDAGGFDFSAFAGEGGLGDIFESFFGGGRHGQARPNGQAGRAEEKGKDREIALAISLKDAIHSVRHTVRLRSLRACDRCRGSGAEPGSKIISCPECGGTGQVTRVTQSFLGTLQQRTICPRCTGSGRVPDEPCTRCRGEGRIGGTAEIAVDIPAGIENGQTLRLRGEGDAGMRGAPAGDLYVRVSVAGDPRFERDGSNVRSTAGISILQALLGDSLSLETLHGPILLKIPEGTQPGQVFRIKGKGLPVLGTSRMGDHYVTVIVKIPAKLGREERRILEEWKKLRA